MANNNEKDTRNSAAEQKNRKSAAPAKKLAVVFRSQNSTSIKELPKSLKKAADGFAASKSGKARPDPGKNNNNGSTNVRRPRPLPAGTKPVRPSASKAAKDETQAEKSKSAAAPKPQESKAAAAAEKESVPASAAALTSAAAAIPAEKPAPQPEAAPKVQAAQEKHAAAESQDKKAAAVIPEQGVSSAAASGGSTASHEEKKPAAEEAPSADDKLKPDKPVQSAEAAAKKETAAPEGREERPREKSAKKPSQRTPEKSRQPAGKAPEKAVAKPAQKPVSPLTDTSAAAPRVKIVKSYANYDVAAVIAEASRKAKKEKAQNSQNQPRTSQGDRKPGYRTAEGAERSQGDKKTQGRTFAPRSTSPSGQRSAKGTAGQSDRKSASPGQSAGRGGFDSGQSKNQHTRGRSAYSSRDKKDKYVDDLTSNNRTKNGKGAFVRSEPKKEKPEEEIKVIVIPQTLTIKDLAEKMRIQPSAIVKKLFLEGRMVTPNTDLSYEEAEEIAMEYEILCEKEVEVDVIAELLKDEEDDESRLVARNPVVCVMGHVDHGKTSLLDAIRNTNVTSHEAGGITQHIGASVVKLGDRHITFLDTPGHEAFTAMRMRGAQSTDIAVLVVAADDGVKPQTIEAINHAKAAKVEVIVAINKMDKPTANPDLVKKELADQGLVSEEWGGSTPMVEVSAKTGSGITDLLDMILLEADVMELRADPKRRARGLVIEAQLDKGRGPVATVLVQKGTLKVGDYVVAGESFGRVRAMVDDKHSKIRQVPPSFPAEILGLSSVPNAGEVFMVCRDEKEAKEIAGAFVAEHKKHMIEDTKKKMNLDDLFDEIKAGNIKELPIIVKADVQGSVEAVKQSLGKLSNEEVAVKVIHSAAGNINESDVSLASASNAIIIGFNVKPDPLAKAQAEQEKIDMRLYKVIYQAIDDLNAALTGMLAPVYEAQNIGKAVVRQIFKSSGVGTIAGCYVTDGVVEKGSRARLYRGARMLFDGDIASLKRFKDEVKEVRLGFECGIVLDDFSDIEVDDNLEVYKMVQVPRT